MHTILFLDRNIREHEDGKKNEGSYLSCVTTESSILRTASLPYIIEVKSPVF